MSIQYLFANNASTTLASPISASSTTISVYPGQGALFPSPTSGQGFTVTLTDAATGKLTEIMLCTNRTGDTLTVTRAQEGTNALAWGAGDFVNNFVTAGSATNWIQSSAFGSPPGTYGTATQIPVLTVNASGQLTAISTVTTTANYCAGGWNAATNTPTLVSSIGQNGQYYVVTVAGTTNLNGYNNWQIGDQALFANGAWLRVAGSESAAFHDITVSSLTGYMYANGSSLVTASPTIPNSGLAHSTITVNGTTLTLGDVGDTITANTPNAVTFNNSGSGTSSGNSFNGGTAITVSYNTIGAPSVTGTGASGTWGIGITGNAASATVATNLQGGSAYALPYQSAAGTTAYLSAGTAGYVLTTNGTGSAPTWTSVGSAAVTTFNAGTTGFTPSTATSGAITLAGTLNAANGGTGATSLTGYVYGNGTGTMTASATIPTTALSGTITNSQLANSSITVNGTSIALGGSGTITAATTSTLTIGTGLSGGSFNGSSAVTIANTGVLTFSGGTTGLTPNTATNGAITLAGTLAVANGGTGVTSSSGANSVVLRDANGNITTNCLFEGYTNQAAGSLITLTAASVQNWAITGSGGQTIKLPDATTLPAGATFTFNNNQSSGTIVVQNNSATTVATVQSGSYITVVLLSNSSAAGSWDYHNSPPSNASWSTNTLNWAGSYTNGTWNGNAVGVGYGGTGLTSLAAGALHYGAGGATALNALPIGTAGQVLTVNSGATAPQWVNASSVVGGAGGSNTQVQYNSSGNLAGSSNLTFDGTNLGLSGGTANGVAYLNGSKVLTTGSALTFDGTSFSVVGRLYNGSASTFGSSTWAMSLGNGGVSANYFKADSTYWQNSSGTQTMQLSSGTGRSISYNWTHSMPH